ncbi:MAG: DUF5615 family PIN-like protein [Bacteroidota bacterium]
MNISPVTVDSPKREGWDATRASDMLAYGVRDSEILLYARENNAVIITHDVDFSALLALGGHSKPSVIHLRIDNARPGSSHQSDS